MEETGNDFIVSTLLSELKSENERKAKYIRYLSKIICGCVLSMLVIIGGFLWYLNQYDFVETDSITANGVYTLIDSEGNVIAQDLTPEEINQVMETIYGQNTSTPNEGES